MTVTVPFERQAQEAKNLYMQKQNFRKRKKTEASPAPAPFSLLYTIEEYLTSGSSTLWEAISHHLHLSPKLHLVNLVNLWKVHFLNWICKIHGPSFYSHCISKSKTFRTLWMETVPVVMENSLFPCQRIKSKSKTSSGMKKKKGENANDVNLQRTVMNIMREWQRKWPSGILNTWLTVIQQQDEYAHLFTTSLLERRASLDASRKVLERKKVVEELSDTEREILREVESMELCFTWLVPNCEDLQIENENGETKEENEEDEEDMEWETVEVGVENKEEQEMISLEDVIVRHGLGSASYSLTIEIPTMITPCHDQAVVWSTLSDSSKLMTKRHVPRITTMLGHLKDSDTGPRRRLLALLHRIEKVIAQYNEVKETTEGVS